MSHLLIPDNKKLKYVVNSLIPRHIRDTYPNWVKIIKAYLEFLDQSYAKNIYEITKNVNINEIYSNLLDDYLANYFKDIIDLDKYQLTDANKRLFLSLSKFITNLKGNKKSFDFLFKSLTNFVIGDPTTDIDVDKITIGYEENESWWGPSDINFYDGSILYNGAETYLAFVSKPFTYRFEIDQGRDSIIDLIRKVHPAGFFFEFFTLLDFSDTQEIEESLTTNVTYFFFYNSSYNYDGSAYYSGSKTYSETF